jgi:precorrin-2/cobalt-factor-2 C20-methyltransferase
MASQRILPLDAVSEEDVPYFSMILVHRRGEAWT